MRSEKERGQCVTQLFLFSPIYKHLVGSKRYILNTRAWTKVWQKKKINIEVEPKEELEKVFFKDNK